MKIKRCFLIFMCALLLVSTVACAGDGGTASSKDAVNSAAESPSVEPSEDSSTEESSVPVPVGFDDGIACGYHILGNSMVGDVLYPHNPSGNEDMTLYTTHWKQGWLLQSYLDVASFTYKTMERSEAFSEFDTFETEVPLASFESITGLTYTHYAAAGSESDITPITYTYEEAKAAKLPMHIALQTVPLAENTVADIQAEYGIDEKQAVSIYRQRVIDVIERCGLYTDGFGDIYFFDTRRAYGIARDLFSWDEEVKVEDYSYEDSVYQTSTHLVFSVYGTVEEIEALEAFLKSESNNLVRMRAMTGLGSPLDMGKPAYIVEDAENTSFYYRHLGEFHFLSAAELDLYRPM